MPLSPFRPPHLVRSTVRSIGRLTARPATRPALASVRASATLVLGLMFAFAPLAARAAEAGQAPVELVLSQAKATQAGVRTARPVATPAGAAQLTLSGTAVTPSQRIEQVAMPVAGVVEAVLVNRLDTVRAGQPLLRIHSPQWMEWQREYVQLATTARLAQQKRDRDDALFAEGIIPESRVQEARNALSVARVAERERAHALRLLGLGEAGLRALADTQAVSPVLVVHATAAGEIAELTAAPGQRLEAGMPLARLVRGGLPWIELQASRAQAQAVRRGDPAIVALCGAQGRVTAIGAEAGSTTQTVAVRVELDRGSPADCLRPNQFVDVVIKPARPAEGTVQVPAAAIVRRGGANYVFVSTGSAAGAAPAALRFRPQRVDVLARGAEFAELRGLTPQQDVAVAGLAALKGVWLGLGAE